MVCLSPFAQAEDLIVCLLVHREGPCAGKKAYTKTIVRPRADQLTSTFTSAPAGLPLRLPHPAGEEQQARTRCASPVPGSVLHFTAAAGDVLGAANATG